MMYFVHKKAILKKICLTIWGFIYILSCLAQCKDGEEIEKKINSIILNPVIGESKKLQQFYDLKKATDGCQKNKDSNYAKILSNIGFYEYQVNGNYAKSISYTIESVIINSLAKNAGSKLRRINDYLNLSYYYRTILLYNQSMSCSDSVITIGQKFDPNLSAIAEAKINKSHIYYLIGDFQKCIDESSKGIVYVLNKRDTFHYVEFLVQRSQSYFFQNMLQESLEDNEQIFKHTQFPYFFASALKRKAMIFEKKQNFDLANKYFNESVNLRIKSSEYGQITNDYIDLGNFYCLSLHDLESAKKSFYKAIEYTYKEKNSTKLAEIFNNLGNLYFTKKNYKEASNYYLKSFKILTLIPSEDIFETPAASILNVIGNTDLITELLTNKVSLLLALYHQTNDKKYLTASIQTALVTDSVITLKRHQQLGEQSKLYWRDRTRDFFTNAVEACFLANDINHAFYFMEKSRSVLLNDKLNELGASLKLNEADAGKELDLKLNILQQQQKLNALTANTAAYNNQQQVFLNAKQNLEDFIKSLEAKYPAYYNYKYSDAVPALTTLQKHLGANNQSFVHYFTNDSLAYILSITSNNAKLGKLLKKDFSYQQINDFLKLSSNRDLTNTKSGFKSFATLSNILYKTLFQPLQLPRGRIIICSDNFLLPFESLCSDAAGTNFLINDYIFSYAYSATNLLKQYNTYKAKGNFIGFAPVTFQAGLHVNPLLNSAAALNKSADNYSSTLLFTNTAATKNNFIKNIGGYTIVNVFSHASADSTETEPKLYMQDAAIHLSELQLINKPAARLVVLSACQTNVGKNATGEGIYSLARGFSSAGIPSIAATLWTADENMIYEISAKFHEYLSKGLSKDIALRNAKLGFLNSHAGSEKSLPYYWANLVLIGNTEPLVLSTNTNKWWWVAGGGTALLAVVVLILKRRTNKPSFRR